MRLYLISILVILLIFYCKSDFDVQTAEMPPPLTDVLTLELSFGDENTITKNEFLLARPPYYGVDVNTADDIYVWDENKIKVFDKYGKEKFILGGPGEGPGEFSTGINHFRIAPTGYLTVFDGRFYSIFSPENKFLEKRQIQFSDTYIKLEQEHNLTFYMGRSDEHIALNADEAIISGVTGPENIGEQGNSNYDLLVYAQPDYMKILAQYELVNTFVDVSVYEGRVVGIGRYGTRYLGGFYYALLPGNKVVYTHAGHDIHIDKKDAYYTLHVVSYDGKEIYTISKKYLLQQISDSIMERPFGQAGFSGMELAGEKVREKLRDAKYLPPLQNIMADGSFIFVFIFGEYDVEMQVDIFDADTGNYLQSAVFPFIPRVIKNGYAYKFGRSEEDFPIVEKYKIDPAVYGK
ncbi:hypothetical protein AMJ80_04165 [bacterium SM23_31]|nr:MAG: hypothetical protein AMJ80_04165 [bacterium SM23_31]